jgi:uncharacterized protein
MLRVEKEITDKNIMESILAEADHCILSLSDGEMPYTVPMNFGFKNNNLYLHSALEGKKIEILRINKRVSFGVVIGADIVKSESPCNWGMKYKSVVGTGNAYFINDPLDKREALDIIMDKYQNEDNESCKKPFKYSESSINSVLLIRVELTDLTGKISGY